MPSGGGPKPNSVRTSGPSARSGTKSGYGSATAPDPMARLNASNGSSVSSTTSGTGISAPPTKSWRSCQVRTVPALGSGTVRAYGAYPVIALGATVAVEQGERLSLSQAFDGIKSEFHVSDTMLGGLAAAMVLVGVVGGVPMGVLADRWRRGLLLAIALTIWTVCMGLGA